MICVKDEARSHTRILVRKCGGYLFPCMWKYVSFLSLFCISNLFSCLNSFHSCYRSWCLTRYSYVCYYGSCYPFPFRFELYPFCILGEKNTKFTNIPIIQRTYPSQIQRMITIWLWPNCNLSNCWHGCHCSQDEHGQTFRSTDWQFVYQQLY